MPPTPSTKSLRAEIGETGTVMIGGIISNQDYNSDMVGARGLRTIDEMRKGDATVRAAALVVKLPILSAHWFVEPATKDEEDVRIAQFVEKQLMEEMTVTWLDFLRETLLYLDYGRYVWEIVWKDVIFEGKPYIGLHKLSPRLPGTIQAWNTENGQDGITQWTMGRNYVSIPMEKLVIFTYEKEGDNWEGTSMFRSAYKNYYIKDTLYKIDAIAHERQGLGIPFVKRTSGAGASKADQIMAAEILENLRANEKGYLDIPNDWDVGFMDMKASATKDAMKSIQHHDRQIVKSVLAQFLELGATSSGSYALGADQSDIFLLALNSICEQVKNTVQKYLIEKIVRYNFATTNMPKLQYSKLGKKDVANLSAAIQRVIQVGALTPDPELEAYLRNVMDLPEIPEEFDLPDDFMAQEMAELEASMSSVEFGTSPEGMDAEPVSDEELAEAAELIMPMLAAGPLNDDHKSKISEALKRYWSTRKKAKPTAKGRKKANPEVTAKQGEMKELRQELTKFREDVRRERLERIAKGEKITKEDAAKLQLKLLDRKQQIEEKINALRSEIDQVKEKETKKEGDKKKADEGDQDGFLGFVHGFRDSIRDIAQYVKGS